MVTVRNIKCKIQEILYKKSLNYLYGMDCNIKNPCLLENILFALEAQADENFECTIPDKLQAEIDKLNHSILDYPAVNTTTTKVCSIAVTISGTDSNSCSNIQISIL